MDNIEEILNAIVIGLAVAHFLCNTNRVLKAIELLKECLILLRSKSIESKKDFVRYKIDIHFQIFNGYRRINDEKSAIECGKELLVLLRENGEREMQGTLAFNLAELLELQCQYKEAKELYEQALSIMIEIGERQEVQACYGALGSILQSLGEYAKAEKYLQKALVIGKELGDIEGEAACYGILGTLFKSLGEYSKAEEYLQKAVFIEKEIGDREGEASGYGHLGSVCESLGEYGKAENCHNKALAIAIEIGDYERISSCYRNLGTMFHSVGAFDKAKGYLQKALAIRKQTCDRKEEADLYGDLGIVFSSLNEYSEAKEYLLKALLIKNEIGDKKGQAKDYGNLASVFQSLGEYAKAEEYLHQALTISKEIGDKNGEASCYGNLGTLFHSVSEYAKAEEYSKKALTISKEIGDKKREATNYGNLGTVFQSLGEYIKARRYYEKALELRKETGDRKGEAADYGNLGTLFYTVGEYAKAKNYHEIALAIRKEIGDKEGEATDSGNLGNVFRDLGEYDKAEKYHTKAISICKEIEDIRGQCEWHFYLALDILAKGDIQKASSNLHASIYKNEDILGFLGESDQFKIAFVDEHALCYQLLSKLFCDNGKPYDALYVVELGRARALADLMSVRYAVEKQISIYPQTWVDIEKIMKNERNCACLYVSYFAKFIFLWILKAENPILFRGGNVDDCITVKGTDRNVDEILGSENFFRMFKVLAQGQCEDRSWFSSSANHPMRESSEDNGLAAVRLVGKEEEDKNQQPDFTLAKCYKMFIAPVVNLLNEPEIIIVPDRSLFKVPFAALKDESGTFLSEKFRIRIVPSLTTLKLIQNSPADYHSQTGALIVGDPDVGRVLYKGNIVSPVRLPFAEKEARMIGRLLGVQPLLGQQATKHAVLQGINSVSLVHFAAHGNAERGEIVLSPPPASMEIPEEKDYLLTMTDISQVRLRAKLVVLSCCHSARGQIRTEGVVGIARAFLGSGARSVLVALSAINDTATEQFMSRFYEHLVDGESASQSLQQAMKWMRDNGFCDIELWAPFMLIGDNVTFDFDK